MRGKRLVPCEAGGRLGLIPAHAGKTAEKPCESTSRWAHPRACGENLGLFFDEAREEGSSPRMRGKHAAETSVGLAERLIPAHAGKTQAWAWLVQGAGAHPRACGENGAVDLAARPALGSSPRMRGKQARVWKSRSPTRLIPAHAGKTGYDCVAAVFAGAHPRACGENPWATPRPFLRYGSSPRMRGKQGRNRRPAALQGLIPAHAGKTRPPVVHRRRKRAHPRACGENHS